MMIYVNVFILFYGPVNINQRTGSIKHFSRTSRFYNRLRFIFTAPLIATAPLNKSAERATQMGQMQADSHKLLSIFNIIGRVSI
jgi:hypothetical protein